MQVAAEAEPTAAIVLNIKMATPETAKLHIVLLVVFLQNRIFPPLVLCLLKFLKLPRSCNLKTLSPVVFLWGGFGNSPAGEQSSILSSVYRPGQDEIICVTTLDDSPSPDFL